MNKVVYNACFGGFGLSDAAVKWLKDRGMSDAGPYWTGPRHHPLLVECVETLGAKANGWVADLRVQVLAGNKYRIDEYNGSEGVVEPNEAEWTVIP